VPAARLAAIRAPTLAVLGGRDNLVGDATRAARRARAHLRDVRIELVPDATHALPIEAADRITGWLLDFLALPRVAVSTDAVARDAADGRRLLAVGAAARGTGRTTP
jgi:dienelactone hydrolase